MCQEHCLIGSTSRIPCRTVRVKTFNLYHSVGSFSRRQIDIFSYFSKKTEFDISSQNQFSGKKKKKKKKKKKNQNYHQFVVCCISQESGKDLIPRISIQTTLFIPTLDTTTKFVIMTVTKPSLIMLEYCI